MADEKAYILAEMSWPEVKEALPNVKLAIIATGSFEQHGPNLALQADTAEAYGFSKLLGARLYPKAVVAPPVNMGISYHHMNFPGTITLRHETFEAILYDMVKSLKKHGINNFFLCNGHGGNQNILAVIAVKLREELGANVVTAGYYAFAPEVVSEGVKTERWGHACEMEVSLAMYLCPEIVKREKLEKGALKPLAFTSLSPDLTRNLSRLSYFDELTANGALGDATYASREFGQAMVEKALERLTAFLEEFIEKSL